MTENATYRQIARIHMECLEVGFLSTLGENFLTLLYASIDECPSAILIVERKGDQVVGFVAGARSMRPIYFQLFRRLPKLIWALRGIVFSPRKIWRIVEIILHSNSDNPGQRGASHELLSIAVSPNFRGKGIATKLYNRLRRYCEKRGVSSFCILVGDDLKAAKLFYTKMGAIVVGECSLHANKRSLIYLQKV